MKRLDGKVALVTGGTRGIGAAIVKDFVAEGARVAFSGTRPDSVATPPAAGARGFIADLAEADAPRQLVAEVLKAFGRIDVLVNNAGVISRASEWDLDAAEWDRVQAVNVRAVFLASQAAARAMKDAGNGGSILNISSIAGQHGGIAGSPAYGASKAAVIGLTRALARRFAPHDIRVNCIAPADIETDMTAGWPQDLRDRLNALTPLGRFGSVEEVSRAATFLASGDASFITGQTLSINGGAYMS
ncbi:MAG: SDR family NAD(P)-dependent oxidoreductase [Hyphomicrobiaceae bacterium]